MARTLRKAGWSLVLLTTIACHTSAYAHCHPGHVEGDSMAPPPELHQAQVKGEFRLTDVKTGKTVERTSYDGRWRLVFFGFTRCHTVCPTGLVQMASLVDRLEQAQVDIVPLFITVDPLRDTPQSMKEYLTNFDQRIVGLSGSPAEVEKAMKSFRIEAPRIEVMSETVYQLDHPALMMLMAPDGKYVRYIPSSGNPDALATELTQSMKAN